MKRIWATLGSLWPTIAWDEMSGFEVNQERPLSLHDGAARRSRSSSAN